ncbi:hypothetical protein VCHA31O73_360019 [Vibrio chagasii]|nr:hypothetical protein VCHA31O73_360019 [Vibrio chagasii]
MSLLCERYQKFIVFQGGISRKGKIKPLMGFTPFFSLDSIFSDKTLKRQGVINCCIFYYFIGSLLAEFLNPYPNFRAGFFFAKCKEKEWKNYQEKCYSLNTYLKLKSQ